MASGNKYLDLADQQLDGLPPELLILKCHLIIETALREWLSARCADPSYLASARLSFAQVSALVRAMAISQPLADSVWEAVEALNQLRNRLAHRLEAGDLSSLLDKISMT